MIYISHRGNIDGPDPQFENKPAYIDQALYSNPKFLVEVDVWVKDVHDPYCYLGHDEPQYEVDWSWLTKRRERLVIHCKTVEALAVTTDTFNAFWHQEDDYTLTSGGWIWAYPGLRAPKGPGTCITVAKGKDYPWKEQGFQGICSDYIESYL